MMKRHISLLLLAVAGMLQVMAAGFAASVSAEDEAPRVVTAIAEGKVYTLECRSANAHNTNRFIGVTDGVVNGQAAKAAYIAFEAAENAPDGYYIKVVAVDKYLNHNGSNISASTEKSTVWTLGVPAHTAGVVTFTIGNDKYLNNNGSDCSDGSCTSLKGNTHAGGPGAGNACSLWQMTEYSSKVLDEPAEPEPTPEPSDSVGKVYYIQWKNTGTNHITEGKDTYLTVSAKNTGKAQFWKFIPTGKERCYYIKNVVTGRYLGSCNMTPASASRVTTSATPVEYYVGATSGTSGEIAGCHYFSSTDCTDYAQESAGPRALNKDGASDYVITWQAGTSRVGSYWKLVETTDTFVKPQHTPLAKTLNIYFNPCGVAGSNFLTLAKVHGEGALDHIVYEAASKPSTWHVPYPHDHGQVVRGATFDISIALKNAPSADLKANVYADWNADGEFEATAPIALEGTAGEVSIAVPETAVEGPVRLRIRINSNGLDLADDDVEGFAYDFHLMVVEPQEGRTASVGANAADRGTVSLSEVADYYAYGTTLTAQATPVGNATFVCWREEGVVVSTEAKYTFTVDRNVNLKAYFTANTEVDTGIGSVPTPDDDEVTIGVHEGKVVATGATEVLSLSLYTIDAALVAHTQGAVLGVGTIDEGLYIARATTAAGCKNVKLYLKK